MIWEYLVVDLDLSKLFDPEEHAQDLEKYGSARWQLVTVIPLSDTIGNRLAHRHIFQRLYQP